MDEPKRNWVVPVIVLCLLVLALVTYRIETTPIGINFQVLSIEDAPAYIYQQYDQQKSDMGYSVITYNQNNYVLITMGAVKTAGYTVEVDEVRHESNQWTIKVHLNTRIPDSSVAEVISYPAITVILPVDNNAITVLYQRKPLLKLK